MTKKRLELELILFCRDIDLLEGLGKGISGGLRGLERGDPGCQSGSQLIREYGTLEPGNSSWMDQLQQWLEGPSAFYELHYFGEVRALRLVGLLLPIGSRWVSPVTAESTLLIPSILVPEN